MSLIANESIFEFLCDEEIKRLTIDQIKEYMKPMALP
jgi:hypothetical protein